MEHSIILSIGSFVVGFLINLVVMRGYFCSMNECTSNRTACEKEREAHWEAIDVRLQAIEKCMSELKLGWKENYKALCDIRSVVNRKYEVV